MEKDLEMEIMDMWECLVPKILDFASDDGNAGPSKFLEAYSHSEVSDGTQV